MTDVFISYARKDNENGFITRIVKALEAKGLDVWFDKDDIPKTSNWWNEIANGIEGANNYTAIITPYFVHSAVCRRELEYALGKNKRLVPILHKSLDTPEDKKALHPALSAVDWIYIQETDDFEAAIQQFVDALNTDLEYVRDHTRLLVRATEWEQKESSTSFVLRGDDLTNAEAWLVDSAGKYPEPTKLHIEYITASRKAANVRQRNLLAGVSVALVVSTILGVMAVYQSGVAGNNAATAVANAATATVAQGQAQNNAATSAANASTAIAAQATSERRADEAQSLALAANARGLEQDRNFDLALALAVQANQIPNPPLDAQRILAELAYSSLARKVMTVLDYTGQPTGVSALTFSPDAQYLLATFDDSSIRLWNLITGEERTQTGLGSRNLAVLPQKSIYATGGNYNQDYPIDLYDFTNQRSITQLKGHDSQVGAVAFSPDGKLFIAGTVDGFLTVWNVETKKIISKFQVSDGLINALTFTPDNLFVVLQGSDYVLHFWDPITGEDKRQFSLFNVGTITCLMFDKQGDYLFTGTVEGTLQMWETGSGNWRNTFTGHTDSVTSIDLSPDGLYLLSGSIDTTVRLWNVQSGTEILSGEGDTDRITAVKFTPDGKYGVSGSSDGSIRFWDLLPGGEAAQFSAAGIPPGYTTEILSVDFSPDGHFIVFGSENGVIERWDLTTQTRIQNINVQENGPVASVVYSPSGNQLLTISYDGYSTTDQPYRLNIWDIGTGKSLDSVKIQANTIANARFGSNSDSIIYETYDPDINQDGVNTTHIYDMSTTSEISSFNAGDMSFSQDGKIAVSSVGDMLGGVPFSDLTLWYLQTGEELKLHIPGLYIFYPKFSPVSDKIIAFLANSSITLWDLSTNTEIRRFESDVTDIEKFVFSPSGQYLAAIGGGVVYLWDVATGLELRRFELVDFNSNTSSNLVFSPDGRYLLVGYSDNTVRLWRVDSVDDLIQWTDDNRYVPELTCAERLTYKVEPYCDANGVYLTRTPYPDTLLAPSSTTIP